MKANSTHISLETAKLLENCNIESKYIYYKDNLFSFDYFYNEIAEQKIKPFLPAYTWQEILWEYYKEFGLGNSVTERIVLNLRSKNYDEADKLFRHNCILIKYMREIKDFAKEFVMYWTYGGYGNHLDDTANLDDVINDLAEKITKYNQELLDNK